MRRHDVRHFALIAAHDYHRVGEVDVSRREAQQVPVKVTGAAI
jgi:hypothetical protein